MMCDFYRSRAETRGNLWRYHLEITTESNVCNSSWFTYAIGSCSTSATKIAVEIATENASKSF